MVLTVSDASYESFGETVFRGVSFTVSAGECVAIVDDEGLGKTTLLRAIAGREQVGGMIRVAGEVAASFDALVGGGTVAEQLAAIDPSADVDALLAGAGVAEVRDRPPAAMSAGQRQRCALIATFLRPAGLVVLDEPENRLDAAGVRWVVDRITRATGRGAAVLVGTHSPVLRECAARVVEL